MIKLKNQNGFSFFVIIIVLLITILIGGTSYFVYKNAHKTINNSLNTAQSSSKSSTFDCSFKSPIACNWYIGEPVLALLYKANPTLTKLFFDHSSVFVAVTNNSELSGIPGGWSVTPIFTYFDESQFSTAAASKTLSKSIKGISLDDELAVCKVYGKAECTPKTKVADPVPYEENASKLAQQAGLTYIDVGAGPDTNNNNSRWHAAAFANYVDSQIQLSEANQSKYSQESKTYLSGWDTAFNNYSASKYPDTKSTVGKVIDGITAKVPTCPTGTQGCTTYKTASPGDILAAVKNTINTGIWGYWLNCPAGNTPGPGPCSPEDVNAMISFLQSLEPVYNQ
jgi:hypothetical protein